VRIHWALRAPGLFVWAVIRRFAENDGPVFSGYIAYSLMLAIFPFVIFAVVGAHVMSLHVSGSNNPLGIEPKSSRDTIPFHPYYTIKDTFGLSLFLIVFSAVVFFAPEFFSDPENYVPADPLQTPAEIVPEWYFLPYFAILRSVPDILFIEAKLAGVIAMFGSIFVLMALPWLDGSPVRSARFRPLYKQFFWLLVIDFVILGWVGKQPATGLPLLIGRIATLYYFLHFLVIIPLLGRFERARPLPNSIAEAVLGASSGPEAREKP